MYFINYNDKELPLIVDFAVINRVCSKLNIKMREFEQTIDDPSQSAVVFYEAIKRGAKLDNIPFEYSEADVEDILSYKKNYGEFVMIFAECILNMFVNPEAKKKN